MKQIQKKVSGSRKTHDPTFSKRQGGLLLRVAGDMKRNPEFLASEVGMPLETVKNILAGEAPKEQVNELIEKMVKMYPVSRLHLEVVRDDTDEGVIIQTAKASKKTSRIFKRKDKNGNLTPYYEYRDAAMSDLGPFKPEWIRELRTVTSEDGDDPDIAYNHGHFLHQFTFYVGAVNLHWKDDKGSHTAFMQTGDSNYGTPYVPHSFTSRDPKQEAYIMAITFAGKLGVAVQQELSVLQPGRVSQSLLDLSSRESAFSTMLKNKLQDNFMTQEVITKLAGIDTKRMTSFLTGKAFPTVEELETLAGALQVNARDLYPPTPVNQKQIVVEHGDAKKAWFYPSKEQPHYTIHRLAGSPKVAEAKGFKVTVLNKKNIAATADLDLDTPMHTFGYNFSDKRAILYWEGNGKIRKSEIEPGASFYIKPLTKHAFRNVSAPEAEIMLIRIGGNLSGDTFFELSSLPTDQMERLLRETGLWY